MPIKMAPAANGKGEPILVPMSILNFGDTPVSFVEGSMKADLATQEAIVIEFTIYRDEVESWDDVKSPMVYLGLKISETKTVKILSTWAVKGYSEQRKPIEHAKAKYVHGYLRVLEAQADPLLARSGWFGIYLVPKNSLKKPHEAYAIILVPNKSPEQLQAIVQSTKNALGIVKTASALAVRCRREHTFAIKKIIYPELPLQEEGEFSQGDRLFVLKHLEIGLEECEGLKATGGHGLEHSVIGRPTVISCESEWQFRCYCTTGKTVQCCKECICPSNCSFHRRCVSKCPDGADCSNNQQD